MSNEFITIGETRIKRSNIKSFGVCHSEEKKIRTYGHPALMIGLALKRKLNGQDFFEWGKRYLYVTTYQNDNYKFYDTQVNIDVVIKELTR
ncbi:MAG: hypothetical protein WCP01_14170 [Methylococcaceae bacterium]